VAQSARAFSSTNSTYPKCCQALKGFVRELMRSWSKEVYLRIDVVKLVLTILLLCHIVTSRVHNLLQDVDQILASGLRHPKQLDQ
jgi:hypothetical protein